MLSITAMRAALVLVLVPSLAQATPSMFGVAFGELQLGSEASGANMEGVFGRLGVTHRLAIGAELTRVAEIYTDDGVHALTLIATIDVLDTGRWIPMVLGGAGVDRGDDTGMVGYHAELGAALEYRGDSGFVFGADLRLGDRAIDPPPAVTEPLGSQATLLAGGTYASGRIYAGIHF